MHATDADDELTEWKILARANELVPAVRALRTRHPSLGLKDSKDTVEAYIAKCKANRAVTVVQLTDCELLRVTELGNGRHRVERISAIAEVDNVADLLQLVASLSVSAACKNSGPRA